MPGSDASIYSLIRPAAAPVDPMAQYGQALQLKTLMGQQELQGLQTQQAKQAIADDQAYRGVLGGMQPGQSLKDILPQIMRVNPKAGLLLQNQIIEQEGKQATTAKTRVETDAALAKQGRDLIAAATPETLPSVLEWGVKNNQQWALKAPAQIMSDPQAFLKWQITNVRDADKFLDRVEPKLTMTDTGGAIIPTNPYTGAQQPGTQPVNKTMSPGERATDARGWAQINQPVWSEDRGAFIPRPGAGGGGGGGGAARPVAPVAAGAPQPAAAVPGAPIVPPNLPPSGKAFDKEDKLRNDYTANPMVKSSSELQNAFNIIETAYKRPSAANDLAMATKFMKILDPTSVVRESEFALAVNATGLLDKVYNYAAAIAEGKKLNPQQRKDFYESAKAINDAFQAERAKVDQQYADMAKEYGLNPKNVIPRLRTPDAKPTETPAPLPPPKLGERKDGYIYKGGNPADPKSWEKASG